MIRQEQGNSLLELVLYLPAAALILFASTDIGLRWSEASALSAALRSGMRVAQVELHRSKEQRVGPGVGDEAIASVVGSRVYEQVFERIQSFKQRSIGREQQDFSLVVQVLKASVEPSSGSVELSSMRVISEHGSAKLSRWRDYISEELIESSSKHSIPRISLSADKGYVNSYAEDAYFVYCRVSSSSASLSRSFILGVFGKESIVEDEVVFSLQELL